MPAGTSAVSAVDLSARCPVRAMSRRTTSADFLCQSFHNRITLNHIELYFESGRHHMITSGTRGKSLGMPRIYHAIFTAAAVALLLAADVTKAQNQTAGQIELLPTGTVVTFGPTTGPTTNPIVTTVLTLGGTTLNGRTYTNSAFLVNDGTGSIDVFGPLTGLGYTPTIGDSLTIAGIWAHLTRFRKSAAQTQQISRRSPSTRKTIRCPAVRLRDDSGPKRLANSNGRGHQWRYRGLPCHRE